jgi:protein SCO1/2
MMNLAQFEARCGAAVLFWDGRLGVCWRPCLARLDFWRRWRSLGDKAGGPENDRPPAILDKVGIAQNLNAQLPLNLPFVDETGRQVQLGSYFGKHPAILALVYYQCPMLCSEELNGLTSALRMVDVKPGKDFNVIVVIDRSERGAGAGGGQKAQLCQALREAGDGGWLAFPDRAAAGDRRADQGGWLRIHEDSGAGWEAEPVCPCQRDPDRDAGGQAGAVLHGRGVFAQGFAAGPGGGLVEQDRHAGRQHFDLLLPLRSGTNTHSLIVARVVQLGGLVMLLALGGFMLVMFRMTKQKQLRPKAAYGGPTGMKGMDNGLWD